MPKEVRPMLGLSGYYHMFIPVYADLAWPLPQLSHKTIPLLWTTCQKAFETLNDGLMMGSILVYAYPNKPYTLFMDVSKYACSVVLTWGQLSIIHGRTIKHKHPITYISELCHLHCS